MEIKFQPFPQRVPPEDVPILVKFIRNEYYPEERYYCMKYTKKYNEDYYVFREAGGEEYSEEKLENAVGWMAYEVLDQIPLDH